MSKNNNLTGSDPTNTILVHEYQRLDLNVMANIIKNNLNELLLFTDCIFNYINHQKI
jgi:uncharacterized protein YutE (UPF0331/DUF86 family)